jgi:ribosomal protein S8
MSHKHHRSDKHKHPKMATLEELEAMYSVQTPPTSPNGYKKPEKNSKNSAGWKYYQKVREYLAEWWEEFNGELDHHGRLKYTSIRRFIKHKTSKHDEQHMLYQMLGPVEKREEGCQVPWLGDWDKRRRNGFGVLDNPEKIRPLITAIKNNVAAAESIKSLTPLLIEEFVQYSALQKEVHQAFAGKGFLESRAADDKKNVARQRMYQSMLWELTKLKIKIVHEIMRVHGVDPNVPQQMRDMAQIAGGIGAAAALTGIAASQSGRLGGIGVPSADGSVIAPYTYDAIKLAEHLTRHAHTFKKPLPPIIEAEMPEEEVRKANGHGKTQ